MSNEASEACAEWSFSSICKSGLFDSQFLSSAAPGQVLGPASQLPCPRHGSIVNAMTELFGHRLLIWSSIIHCIL